MSILVNRVILHFVTALSLWNINTGMRKKSLKKNEDIQKIIFFESM